MCFKWCVLAHLHPVHRRNHPDRLQHYTPFADELLFDNLAFPISLKDIKIFENLNNISVNVYGLETILKKSGEYVCEVVGPLHHTSKKRNIHVNLLLISNDFGQTHYCLIRNMSRLLNSQLNKNAHAKYFCDGCLLYFHSQFNLDKHQQHDCNHIYTKLPTTNLIKDKTGNLRPENILKFENYGKKLKVPFVVYADFECILQPISFSKPNPQESFTVKSFKHNPHSFAYFIKCSFDDSLSKFYTYRGPDCAQIFIETLTYDCEKIYSEYFVTPKPMNDLTFEQKFEFENAKCCHICLNEFEPNSQIVRDHCHLTGQFRGAAHGVCNLNFQLPHFIPVFHNLSNYDAHLKYITFSKTIINQTGAIPPFRLKFLDSFRFMASSLDKLAQNLNSDQFVHVRKYFSDVNKFNLIRQKGVFPYSYIDSYARLKETRLPSYNEFYDQLRDSNISENDYTRANEVWNLFECKNLGEYSDLYLKSDVLLLTDVYENFREICLNIYGLDPAQYLTAPGLAWDAALKLTGVELELFTDVDMIHFIKKGIRGGISMCSKRQAVANNVFIPNYDANKPSSFIIYIDATNLYGASMSEVMPIKNFEWLSVEDVESFSLNKNYVNSEIGYILEVDLEYPQVLHDLHNDLPFCVESIIPPNSKTKIKKLIPNLRNKEKYVIHIRNLQQAIANGLILTKIYRILKFKQSAWLKPYIDLNTQMRNKSKNKFEKDFFKLMNNSVFGKTMENVDKRVDVRLLTHWKRLVRKWV
ncbi:hypothetical protein RN001_002249 [Aquatica leii]|uniref:DNA-directed DNA polymerase n=1 Tax=Aquatica leii TaxID=1421715 RepID=A0AAN7QND9_9COLE|nr:hypothetical protein RN001_002249 [Aquatica leii]